jgi:phosphoenolpyruvate carboxykinase (GTP)
MELPTAVAEFIGEADSLCAPDSVHLVDGSDAEHEMLLAALESTGTLTRLDPDLRPGSYAARSDPADVARSTRDTYICSERRADAGPLNNWAAPREMKAALSRAFRGCMRGRTMYVVPFCMGPADSPAAKFCVQLTDSPYVVVHLRLTTRMGQPALDRIAAGEDYLKLWHSVGCPLIEENRGTPEYDKARSSWPCNILCRKIVHFPETREVWSFGSGYGGNALLGKKCVALRIASVQGRDEGWFAEHMLIAGITDPTGVKRYIAAAFPSGCGKTNLSMMEAALPGYKVETIGDDIAWLRFDAEGRLRAINPENGFFGVAPGTSSRTNPNAVKTISQNAVFTNVATTSDGDVFWEGMDGPAPPGVTTWLGEADWTPGTTRAAHRNARFAAPLQQCPCLDPAWNDTEGVPIDAIVFGARRDDTMPLVFEAFDWAHGVFLGASMRSNATAASDLTGLVYDPMAMSPFIGYNVKDYFAHWLSLPETAPAGVVPKLPKVFHVNWFLRDKNNQFLWPGFDENARVIAWILDRCAGKVGADTTQVGLTPRPGDINIQGLPGVTETDMRNLLKIDVDRWRQEAAGIREVFETALMNGCDVPVPAALMDELAKLESRLGEK